MKFTYILLALFCLNVQAAPKLDVAVGTPDINVLTVVPDSKDNNTYYLFPQRFGVALDANGRFRFSYQEYGSGFLKHRTEALVEISFAPQFDKNLVDQKISQIRQNNPNAKFTFVPMVRGSINPPKILLPLMTEAQCEFKGLVMGQDVVCQQRISSDGRELYRKRLKGNLSNVFLLNYSFVAQVMGQESEIWHSVAMYASGINDSQLYRDRKGRPIEDNDTRFHLKSALSNQDEVEFVGVEEAQARWGIE